MESKISKIDGDFRFLGEIMLKVKDEGFSRDKYAVLHERQTRAINHSPE